MENNLFINSITKVIREKLIEVNIIQIFIGNDIISLLLFFKIKIHKYYL